ncbi:zinc transport system substrate-binding protein [Rhodovulum imhoffii]|uniref:High-affinity zinc uptake system protein ZnuA n=1 Tax=Rhodovulum imhoffii TaxID=365340 RepID=A0A2T5BW24_9RHOB|nr:zinc ABC transporter substrate-binding protein [Rhodovulum imhoffii]MBK5933560.1 hypothetical protein [Rhodovulum imhoffii]PTN03808.1 zinc transport system substrate-binding protein [Rhodovulum imhoffii]
MRRFLALAVGLVAMPALAAPPAVMTDTPVVHSLAAQVMGDLDAPGILLGQGANPHHFQLRPSQARALSEADLVLWVGPDLTPWLARAIEGVGLSGRSLILIDTPGTQTRRFTAHHDEDDHAHPPHENDDPHDLHAHESLDPHAWLDPDNGRIWIHAIADVLGEIDPENAEIYAANAQTALARIARAEAAARETLSPVGNTPIMVFHDAYSYFADHFGLHIAGAIALGDAATPGAARLTALREELFDRGPVCLFPEAQHDPAYVNAIAEGTPARIGPVLDPSGSTLTYGPELYGTLLETLATQIASCITAR